MHGYILSKHYNKIIIIKIVNTTSIEMGPAIIFLFGVDFIIFDDMLSILVRQKDVDRESFIAI